MRREVILFGKILPSEHLGMFVLDVEPSMGDAPLFQLGGLITFKAKEVFATELQAGHLPDIVRIPEHIARLKAELAGNVRRKKKR